MNPINKIKTKALFLFILSITFNTINAQRDTTRSSIIHGISNAISNYYFYKEEGILIADSLIALDNNGYFDSILLYDDFLWELTTITRSISGQNHFDIVRDTILEHHSTIFNKLKSKYHYHLYKKRSSKENIDFDKIEILANNIGYLKINDFEDEYSKHINKRIKSKTAIKKVINTDALIIDLRDNVGGSINIAVDFTSFLVNDSNEYYLTLSHYKTTKDSSWDRKQISKLHFFHKKQYKTHYNKPIYILTSNYTFSTSDIVSYILKTKANATIIGETTGGSGLGIYTTCATLHNVKIRVPSFALNDTIHNYSFDKPVEPDIKTTSDSSLLIAYKLITNSNKDSILYTPFNLIGDFGRVKIFEKKNQLYLKYDFSLMKLLIKDANNYKTKYNDVIKFQGETLENAKNIEIKLNKWVTEKYSRRN